MQIALPWIEEKIASAEDVVVLYVTTADHGEEVVPEVAKVMRGIVKDRFPERSIEVYHQVYAMEDATFPLPAERVYFFQPNDNHVIACLEPTYAIQNLAQYIYHTESVWKKIHIRDLLDRDKIFTDEDMQKFQPAAQKSPDDIIRLQAEEYPSVWSMFKSFFGTGRKVIMQGIKDRKVFAKPDVVEKRLDMCRECEHFVPGSNRCKKCGCGMDGKARFLASECPIGNW